MSLTRSAITATAQTAGLAPAVMVSHHCQPITSLRLRLYNGSLNDLDIDAVRTSRIQFFHLRILLVKVI